MRNTMVNGRVQEMIYPNDYKEVGLRRKQKGMKIILTERGLEKSMF